MKKHYQISRREFNRLSSIAVLGAQGVLSSSHLNRMDGLSTAKTMDYQNLTVPIRVDSTIWIFIQNSASFQERLAQKELARGLDQLLIVKEIKMAELPKLADTENNVRFFLLVDSKSFSCSEEYRIETEEAMLNAPKIILRAASPQALLYAVFDFIERQGVFFGLDGETYPLDKRNSLWLPRQQLPLHVKPRFKARGLVPWPDFLNCITVFNEEEHRTYLENMLRLRFNMLGIHVYTTERQWAESFLSFEYGGVGHISFTDTSATNRWGYIPQKTSRYGMGAAQYYDSDVFGSEATTRARNCWEAAELAQQLWRESFRYAEKLGIETGIGFEPYKIPDEIFKAVPPEAHYVKKEGESRGSRIDPESVTAKDILERRLAQLLEAYPSVKYVWLWEDEGMSWDSQKNNVPLSVTPFRQTHDFLRRHAPDKRLVVSGWGGAARHFEEFHRKLPGDIIFACLSDNLGWDPVHEVFGKLEDRERWPIPWLEDDPGMWLPQFHVHRFHRDMNLAEEYGCSGLLGIHWRHRIMDINTGYQSRFSWDKDLSPEQFYRHYGSALVRSGRAEEFAAIMTDTDKNRTILNSFTGEIKNGHHQVQAFSGDYSEAFTFWANRTISDEVLESQRTVSQELRRLADSASSPKEWERLEYITRHVEFLNPFAESWKLAMQIHKILQDALQLKRNGQPGKAREMVRKSAVPLWTSLAYQTREAILNIQRIVSDRNDLGTLASMHNKFERLTLVRLRLSMKEFLGELPEIVENIYQNVTQPDLDASPRLFVPTRPGMLEKGKKVRITAVAPGPREVIEVRLYTRLFGMVSWKSQSMKLKGRRTYEGHVGPVNSDNPFLDYFVEARIAGPKLNDMLTAPLEAPEYFYRLSII